MHFTDGSTEKADLLIGCNWIKSQLRKVISGKDGPATSPVSTGKFAWRVLLPMKVAAKAMGGEFARNSQMFLGPHTHVSALPLGKETVPGDATHASTPHQGSGVETAMEAAFILFTPLSQIHGMTDLPGILKVYNPIRRPRSQRLVSTSRGAGQRYDLVNPSKRDYPSHAIARSTLDVGWTCKPSAFKMLADKP